jgi:LacI family transcriptional regulator
MRDVALRAGVSVSTVSNAFNHPDRVSESVLRKVQSAIDELGFARNEAARQLRDGHSRTVGFVMLDGKNPFFMDVARGAEDRAAPAGLAVMFGDSARDSLREGLYLDLFEQQRVRGVLISPYGDVEERLHRLTQRGIGVVLLNRKSVDESFSSVSVDDVAGGRLAIEHLIARGRRRIAFVGSNETIQFSDRLAGASEAIAVNPDVSLEILEVEAPHVINGRAIGVKIASRAPKDRPDGIFAGNDVVAMGILQGLIMGSSVVAVPHEIALIGYDDIDFAGNAVVPLSSIRHPAGLIGSTAVDILLSELENPSLSRRQVVFQPALVARASTSIELST